VRRGNLLSKSIRYGGDGGVDALTDLLGQFGSLREGRIRKKSSTGEYLPAHHLSSVTPHELCVSGGGAKPHRPNSKAA
jgi:hypothetical protein